MTLQPTDSEVKRRYHAPRRKEQARETREAIVAAAVELFTEQGFQETSIRQIAERASVSDQTVYNAFEDKIGVLVGAGMAIIDAGVEAAEHELLEVLRSEPDPWKRLRIAARSSRLEWESGSLELELLVLAPDARDPRLEALAERGLAHKVERTRAVCEVLFPVEIRRSGIELDDLAQFVTAIDSGAVVSMVVRLGWSMDQWERWAFEFMTGFLDPGWVSNHPEPR